MPSLKIIGILVLKENILEGLYHIWAWQQSWSCDLDHLYKLSFPLPKKAQHKQLVLTGQAFSVEEMFENGGHIHVYSPGADNTLGSNFFH